MSAGLVRVAGAGPDDIIWAVGGSVLAELLPLSDVVTAAFSESGFDCSEALSVAG